VEEGGELLQLVQPHLFISVPVTDLRHFPKAERDAEVDKISMREARWRFDLSKSPLFRVSLLRVADEEHVLLVNAHHTVVDYWSIGIMAGELGALYTAYSRGVNPSLAHLPVQYGDFSVWQREQAGGEAIEQESSYWKRQLANLPLLDFPTDKGRQTSPTFDATITSILLPTPLTDCFRELANREGVTFFNAMLSVLSMVLYQYTGQTDFGVATQVGGRASSEIELLIGLFINTVVLRPDLSGDPTFRELLGRIQDVGGQAIAHHKVRFEQLLRELRPSDYPSHHTLFRINFICQRDPVKPQEFEGVKLTVIPSKSQGALYDLHVFLVGRNEGWRLACEYNTDLYEASTITGLLADYRQALENVVANPDLPISLYPVPDGAAGRRRMSESASHPTAANREPETEGCAMPASVAQRRFWTLEQFSPGNPALHMRACVRLNGSLQLDALEKSLQALIDRHETLRTTFDQGEDELYQLIAPSREMLLPVTSLEQIPEADRDVKLHSAIREEAATPFDLARGPCSRARLFRLGEQEHVLIITTHHILADGWSQNVIQRDLWGFYEVFSDGREPDLQPISVHYADYVQWQREWLASEGAREEIEFWKAKLASPMRVLDIPIDHPSAEKAAPHGPMETLLLPSDLTQSLKRLSQSRDATMFMVMLTAYSALLYRCAAQEDILVVSPVANRRPETEPLIGPLAGPVSLRLNLSGNPSMKELLDRVRDVTIEALSHAGLPFEALLDNIDIRSVRGRNPLSQCYFFYQTAFLQPRVVRDLTVTPLPDFGLGTHFELQMGLLDRREGLRAQLEYNPTLFEPATIQNLLTSYESVLHAFAHDPEMRLSALPVSALQSRHPAPLATLQKAELVLPHDETEKQLIHIWENVLRVKPIGLRDDYFELGGNSLLAVHLVSQIEKSFRVRLPLSTLIHAPTVEALAQSIRGHARAADWSAVVEIQKGNGRPKFFCVHGAGGNVLIYRDLARRLGPDQPCYGLQCQGLDGKSPPLKTIEEMAALYVREIQKLQPHGPYLLGGYCMGGTVALEMAQQLKAEGEEVSLLALLDTMNWSKLKPATRWDRFFYQVQRVGFHAGNFLLLDWSGKRKFFEEKVADLRARATVWRGELMDKFSRKSAADPAEPQLLAQIWRLNDEASMRYGARPYSGVITDFRSFRQYVRYKDYSTNWDDVALEGQRVVTLPVYPAGMLLEPFVKDLAAALREAIDSSVQPPVESFHTSAAPELLKPVSQSGSLQMRKEIMSHAD
jgi:non-ribosomal peptide synthetase component F/thioesterase domain-containing protein